MMANRKKRVLSLLLAAVLAFSLLPVTALAAYENQVMNGYYVIGADTQNPTTTQNESNTGGGFTVKKSIAQTDANAFNINLQVVTQQVVTTKDAAVQLVIDTSGSMGDDGRLAATINAINGTGGFIDSLVSGNQNGGRVYVSVIEFSGGRNIDSADTVCDWTDITSGGGARDVKTAVGSLEAGGGTNLEAGLMLARNRLSMSAISDVAADNRYTVLLTDGEPTARCNSDHLNTNKISDYNEDGSGMNCSDDERNEAASMATQVKAQSKLYTICYGVGGDTLYTTSGDPCTNCGKNKSEHYGKHHKWCNASKKGTKYTPTKTTVTIGDYLRDQIATPASGSVQYAYNASDATDVNSMFQDIATSSTSGMNGSGTQVVDPMGTNIVLGDVSTLTAKGVTTSADHRTLYWNLDPANAATDTTNGTTTYTYTLEYPITLDTSAEGFQENYYYPTNGHTYLSYGSDQTLDFNVPGVKGTIPEYGYTVEYYKQNQNGSGYTIVSGDTDTGPQTDLHTTVSAPYNYVDKYKSDNYHFASGTTSLVITGNPANNVIKLYYDRDTTAVTVNHYYTTTREYYENGKKKSETTEDKVLRNPVSDTGFVGDSYTAAPVTAASDGKGDYSLDPAGQNQTISSLSKTASNVINLYYSRTYLDGQTTSVTVNHNWTLNTWSVDTNGQLTKATTSGNTGAGPVSGYYVSSTYQASEDSNLIANGFVNQGGKTQSIILKEDGAQNVISFNYSKDAYPADTATATVKHEYITKTISYVNGVETTTDSSDWGPDVLRNGYDGQKLTAESVDRAGFTRTTPATTVTLKTNNPGQTVTIQYERTIYPEAATIQVIHHYQHQVWQVTTDEQGAVNGGSWVDAVTQPNDYTVPVSGTYYAGMTYPVGEDTNGLTGYVYQSGGDKGTQTLKAGQNTFNLYYLYQEETDDDRADVTVYHNYYQTVSYIDSNGQVATRLDLIAKEVTGSGDSFSGLKGEPFTAVPALTYDGNEYNVTSPSSMSGILQTKGGVFNINYMAAVDKDEKVPVTLTVTHTYNTYDAHVDKDGKLVTGTITSTATGESDTITGYFVGQSYTAIPKHDLTTGSGSVNYPDFDTGSDPLTLPITDAGTKTINLIYKRTTNTLDPASVTVKHVYQTLVKEVVNGEYKEYTREDNNSHQQPYSTGLYAGMKFTADADSVSGTEYVCQTSGDELTTTLSAGNDNQITIYYLRTQPDVDDAQYQVVHNYKTFDYKGDLINDAAYTYTETGNVLTSKNGVSITESANTKSDLFTVDSNTAATQTKTLSKDGVTVFTFDYSRTLDTRAATNVKVIHKYYAKDTYKNPNVSDADFIAANPTPEYTTESVITGFDKGVWVGNSYTAAQVPTYTVGTGDSAVPYSYNFVSADPENLTISSLSAATSENADPNVITISYVRNTSSAPENAAYQVVHEYYLNGTLAGKSIVGYNGKIGATVNSSDVARQYTYEGRTYSFSGITPVTSLVIDSDATKNVFTLAYVNYTGGGNDDDDDTPVVVVIPENPTPEAPTPELPVEIPGNPTPEASAPATSAPAETASETAIPGEPVPLSTAPQTGDPLASWVALASVSGLGLVWLAITGYRKRRDENQ